jgi:hypothetical protein
MKRRNTEMAVGNASAPMQPLGSREKDHQHANGDNDQGRKDQKQIGTLGMLAATVFGTFLGAGHAIALPESTCGCRTYTGKVYSVLLWSVVLRNGRTVWT